MSHFPAEPGFSSSSLSPSGFVPIRAPLTPDDNEIDSHYFSDNNEFNAITSGSDYGSDESGECFETREELETLPPPPLVAGPGKKILQESVEVEKYGTFRPFVMNPEEEILVEGCDDEENYTFRSFGIDSQVEIVEEGYKVEKYENFRPFVRDAEEEILEGDCEDEKYCTLRSFVKDTEEEILEEGSVDEKCEIFRPFVKDTEEEFLEEGCEYEKCATFRPLVGDSQKGIVEEGCEDEKYEIFRPFVEDPEEEFVEETHEVEEVENFRPYVRDNTEGEILEKSGVLEKYGALRPFLEDSEKKIVEDGCEVEKYDRPLVRDPEEESDEGSLEIVHEDEKEGSQVIESTLVFECGMVENPIRNALVPIANLSRDDEDEELISEPEDNSFPVKARVPSVVALEKTSKEEDVEMEFRDSTNLNVVEFKSITQRASSNAEEEESLAKDEFITFELAYIESSDSKLDMGVDFFSEENRAFEDIVVAKEMDIETLEIEAHRPLSNAFAETANIGVEQVETISKYVVNARLEDKISDSSYDSTLEVEEYKNLDLTSSEGAKFIAMERSEASQSLSEIHSLLLSTKNVLDFSLTILVLGKAGVGKSATVNSIFGEEKAKTNPFEPTTSSVKEIIGIINGLRIRILDTPGLRSSSIEDQAFNRKILLSINKMLKKFPLLVVLYVDRLDPASDYLSDLPLLRLVNNVLGPLIWKRTIVVLTHANTNLFDGPCESTHRCCRNIQLCISRAADDYTCFMGPGGLKDPVFLIENASFREVNGDKRWLQPIEMDWKSILLLACYSKKIFDYERELGSDLSRVIHHPFSPQLHAADVVGDISSQNRENFSYGTNDATLERIEAVACYFSDELDVQTSRAKTDGDVLSTKRSQFSIGGSCTKMCIHIGLNNRGKGELILRTGDLEEVRFALMGIVPAAFSIFGAIISRFYARDSQ